MELLLRWWATVARHFGIHEIALGWRDCPPGWGWWVGGQTHLRVIVHLEHVYDHILVRRCLNVGRRKALQSSRVGFARGVCQPRRTNTEARCSVAEACRTGHARLPSPGCGRGGEWGRWQHPAPTSWREMMSVCPLHPPPGPCPATEDGGQRAGSMVVRTGRGMILFKCTPPQAPDSSASHNQPCPRPTCAWSPSRSLSETRSLLSGGPS